MDTSLILYTALERIGFSSKDAFTIIQFISSLILLFKSDMCIRLLDTFIQFCSTSFNMRNRKTLTFEMSATTQSKKAGNSRHEDDDDGIGETRNDSTASNKLREMLKWLCYLCMKDEMKFQRVVEVSLGSEVFEVPISSTPMRIPGHENILVMIRIENKGSSVHIKIYIMTTTGKMSDIDEAMNSASLHDKKLFKWPVFLTIKNPAYPQMVDARRIDDVFTENDAFNKALLHENALRIYNDSIAYHKASQQKNVRLLPFQYLLHGPPGTGKTKLLREIGLGTKRHVFNIRAEGITNTQALRDFILGISVTYGVSLCNVIVVIDEAHLCPQLTISHPDIITAKPSKNCASGKKNKNANASHNGLSALLECFQGLILNYNLMIFWTANSISVFAPALIRPGRMRADETTYIGYLGPKNVMDYFQDKYGRPIDPQVAKHIVGKEFTIAQITEMFATDDSIVAESNIMGGESIKNVVDNIKSHPIF